MAERKNSLLAKLEKIEARYSEIEKQIADPSIAGDSAKLIALSKEQGKLKTIAAKYREYKKAVAGIEEGQQDIPGKFPYSVMVEMVMGWQEYRGKNLPATGGETGQPFVFRMVDIFPQIHGLIVCPPSKRS